MKKVLSIFIGLFVSALAFGQGGHMQLTLSSNLGPNNSNEEAGMSFVPAIDIKASYNYQIGRLLEVGAGTGVGFSSIITFETRGINKETGAFESYDYSRSPSIPVFILGKMKWYDSPSAPFLKVEGGHRIAWVRNGYGGHFNPYIFHVIPSVGYEFSIGSHALDIEAGFEYMWYKKTHQCRLPENFSSGGRLDISANNYNGIYLAVSFGF